MSPPKKTTAARDQCDSSGFSSSNRSCIQDDCTSLTALMTNEVVSCERWGISLVTKVGSSCVTNGNAVLGRKPVFLRHQSDPPIGRFVCADRPNDEARAATQVRGLDVEMSDWNRLRLLPAASKSSAIGFTASRRFEFRDDFSRSERRNKTRFQKHSYHFGISMVF
jgi:hypothetical protein